MTLQWNCVRIETANMMVGEALARPGRLERPTLGFEVLYSIQLSYGRNATILRISGGLSN